MLELVGANLEVPLVTGTSRRYVNLDFAASAPALVKVRDAVDEFLPWYSSVHRGAGYKSILATEVYEWARQAVASFVGATDEYVVIFTRNTTDSINLLASAMPDLTEVIAFESEHHANLLPWRRRRLSMLPAPLSASQAVTALEGALASSRRAERTCLVAVTGASNVTGEIWPIKQMAVLAHSYGARLFVDAAQLAPRVPIDMAALEIDYLACSGHKLYAPYGTGALIGRPDWLRAREPFLAGGGAVTFVTADDVLWADLPERQEAGSPNVVGALALGVACSALQETGMDCVEAHERNLMRLAEEGLSSIDTLDRYILWAPDASRIGVLTFNLTGFDHSLVAAVLSAEYGIGVRDGCFCAHPLLLHLLDIGSERADQLRSSLRKGERRPLPGAVRASFGVGSSTSDVERLVDAIRNLVTEGPSWEYQINPETQGYYPAPDSRLRPSWAFTA